MSVNNVSNASPNTNVFDAQSRVVEASLMRTMTADDIMTYVRSQLGSIDGQMNDYKNLVVGRQKKSEELRDITSLVRDLKGGSDEIKSPAGDPVLERKYNTLMTLLAKNSDNPSAKSAYDAFLASYGGYHATERLSLPDGRVIEQDQTEGTLAGVSFFDDQDMYLNATETQGVMDNVKQALESVNSDNEMTMMELQKLMQQRNQITQFASNALNVDSETKKAVIGNIR